MAALKRATQVCLLLLRALDINLCAASHPLFSQQHPHTQRFHPTHSLAQARQSKKQPQQPQQQRQQQQQFRCLMSTSQHPGSASFSQPPHSSSNPSKDTALQYKKPSAARRKTAPNTADPGRAAPASTGGGAGSAPAASGSTTAEKTIAAPPALRLGHAPAVRILVSTHLLCLPGCSACLSLFLLHERDACPVCVRTSAKQLAHTHKYALPYCPGLRPVQRSH